MNGHAVVDVVVGVVVSQSTLMSPVNLLTPLTASSTVAASSSTKPVPNYSNVCVYPCYISARWSLMFL